MKMLSKLGGLKNKLRTLSILVDADKLSKKNVDAARTIMQSKGAELGAENMIKMSPAAAELSAYVANVIAYFDVQAGGAEAKGKIVIRGMIEAGHRHLTKPTLATLRFETPPQEVQQVFIATMHLLGGMDLGCDP